LENVFEGRVITKNIDMLKNMSEQDRSKFVEELIKFL